MKRNACLGILLTCFRFLFIFISIVIFIFAQLVKRERETKKGGRVSCTPGDFPP